MSLNLLALSIVIVIAGRWSDDKTITTDMVVGALLAAVMLTAIETVNSKLAQGFAFLILLTAIYTHVPLIAGFRGARQGGKK